MLIVSSYFPKFCSQNKFENTKIFHLDAATMLKAFKELARNSFEEIWIKKSKIWTLPFFSAWTAKLVKKFNFNDKFRISAVFAMPSFYAFPKIKWTEHMSARCSVALWPKASALTEVKIIICQDECKHGPPQLLAWCKIF